MNLKNKTIIVTGGSKGIGLEISKNIIKNGGKVIIISSNENNLERAKSDIEYDFKKLKKNAYFYSLDISNQIAINYFANWIKRKFKKINGLVNCAGIYGPIGKTNKIKLYDFERTININLLGTVYMTNLFINLYDNVKYKRKIIIFSGGGASSSFPNYTAYSISKIALVKLTENLSYELKDDNIDINCIAPGFVITDIHQETLKAGIENVGEDFYKNTLEQIKNGGVSPDKPVNLNNFLLSEKSDNISGKFISAAWDPWETNEFQMKLKNDKDFATLRRIDEKTYFKK